MKPYLSAIVLSLLFFVSPSSAAEERRMLFVGNSITLHGPAKDIGWEGNWGMAASSAEKDYVHLVVDEVAKRDGARPKFKAINAADFERGFAGYDGLVKLKEEIAFGANVVIVAIGENVPALTTEEMKAKFKESLVKFLTLLKGPENTAGDAGAGAKKLYVRSCFWADATKDAILKEACAAVGGVFIDIGSLGKDETNFARSERKIAHAGVAGHPGDKGMRAIAEAVAAKLELNK